MKKVLGAMILVIIAAIGIGSVLTTETGPGGASVLDALPKFDAAGEHIFIRVAEPSSIRPLLDGASRLIDLVSDEDVAESIEDGIGSDAITDAMNSEEAAVAQRLLGVVGSVVSLADDLSFLADGSRVLIAMLTDDEKFAKMKEVIASEARILSWQNSMEGESFVIGDGDKLGFHSFSSSSRPTLVLIGAADDESIFRTALDAWKESEARGSIKRALSEQNFMTYSLKLSAPDGSESTSAGEMDWKTAKGQTTIRTKSASRPEGMKTSGFEANPIPLFGTSEPTLFFSFDLPFILSNAFPGSQTPVRDSISLIEKNSRRTFDRETVSILESILGSSRVTAALTVGKDQLYPKNAYVALENRGSTAADDLVSLASFFGDKVDVAGWENAWTAHFQGVSLFVGKNADKIVIGIGDPSEYANAAPRPAAMASLPEKPALSGAYISFEDLSDPNSVLGKTSRAVLDEDSAGRKLAEMLDALGLSSIKSIASAQSSAEDSKVIIDWK